jgi:predicted RNase H-like HicB family nuclease
MPATRFAILTLEFWREDGQWVGRCRELTTSTFGARLEDVQAELVELVELHLSGLQDVGELERVLTERAIRVCSGSVPETIRDRFRFAASMTC